MEQPVNRLVVSTPATQQITLADIVSINVGGVKFETLKSTLERTIHRGRLANLGGESEHFCAERGEYFYDRDPRIFSAIIDYYRFGEMHLPHYFCSVRLEKEFEFWGLETGDLEPCCWWRYQESVNWLNKQKLVNDLAKVSLFSHDSSGPEEAGDQTACCPCWRRWRPRLWDFLDHPYSSKMAEGFAWLSVLMTVVSLFTLCAETHPNFRQNLTSTQYAHAHNVPEDDVINSWQYYGTQMSDKNETGSSPMNTSAPKRYDPDYTLSTPLPFLEYIDLTCHIFFILELVSRFSVSPNKRYFVTSAFNIIDLLSIVPFAIDLVINCISQMERFRQTSVDSVSVVRVLRILRVIRIFRLVRRYRGLQVLIITLRASTNEFILLGIGLSVGMFIFSSLVYYADMATFHSIPGAFWWAIVTMTTVGYGDMTPKSNWGYFVGSLCAISGVLVIAFTVPEIVSNFLLFYQCSDLNAPQQNTEKHQQERRIVHEESVDLHATNCVEMSAITDKPIDYGLDSI